MAKRKSLSNKIRFEVFKRDSFTCQYCGKAAPDVILEVDHINPVANGGDNEIINLVTSCKECNSGKSARTLDDKTVVQKQRQQLNELNERRLQLEMVIKWREELDKLSDVSADAVEQAFSRKACCGFTETGRKNISKLLKEYSLQEVLDAVNISTEQYIRYDAEGTPTNESIEKSFKYLRGICRNKKEGIDQKDVYYIRAILRNRLNYYDERRITKALFEAKSNGYDMDFIKEKSKEIKNWSEFREFIYDYADVTL